MKLEYSLSMPEPETHLFHVELRIRDAPSEGPLRVALPAWTPGSYLVRDYARHVQDFEALDGRGQPLEWRRADKQTWEITPGGGSVVTLRYRVYANELSVQTSHLDATHGYGNGTNLFLYVEDRKDLPATLAIKPPRGWHVDIALKSVGANTFEAPDYDALVDAPFEIGTHRRLTFRAAGKDHRIALYGHGNEDEARIVADLKAIVEEEASIFGSVPYEEYLFLIHLSDRARGGLEHRHSNTSAVDRWTFQPPKKYEDFLALEAHEFFHTWNVKRLRPRVLGPFDYSREVHTTLLWAMEGITSYYDHLVLARAGLITEERYREFVAETITKLREQPGRFQLSLAQSSFLTWIKLYKQDANWINTGVSYYLKGELVAMVLDLAIRDRTDGKLGLDDVMRRLYEKYPPESEGIPEPHTGGSAEPGSASRRRADDDEDGWRKTLEEVTGLSWRSFWRKYIEGTDEVDFERYLKKVGWDLKPVRAQDKAEERAKKGDYSHPPGWLGLDIKEVDGHLKVKSVLSDSPAMKAGLAPDDELVALNGYKVASKEFLEKRLKEQRSGDVIRLHVFRRGELVETRPVLAEAPPEKWVIEEQKKPSARAKRLRRAWLAPAAGIQRARPAVGVAPEGRRKGARNRVERRGQ